MLPDKDEFNSPLKQQAIWLEKYKPGLRIEERGVVRSLGDGIARITGLPSAAMNDILTMEDGSRAMVFDLTEGLVSAVLLHETSQLTAGTPVHHANHPLSVPVGDSLLGRIIDPLGSPHDGKHRQFLLPGNVWILYLRQLLTVILLIRLCTPVLRLLIH